MYTHIHIATNNITSIGIGSNSSLGEPNIIYTATAAICAARMDINKVSRAKYWGGGALAPSVPMPMTRGMCMYCGLALLLKKEHGNEHLSIFAIPRLNSCHLGQVSLQRDGDSTLTNQLPDVGCNPITTEGTSE